MIPNNVAHAYVNLFCQAGDEAENFKMVRRLICLSMAVLYILSLTFPWLKMSVCSTICLPFYAAYNYFIFLEN